MPGLHVGAVDRLDRLDLRRSGSTSRSGSGTTRSLSPLPSRTTICRRAKSRSLTRSRQLSSSRRPAPYISSAMSRGTPAIRSNTARTSSVESTTGSRLGRFARGRSSSRGGRSPGPSDTGTGGPRSPGSACSPRPAPRPRVREERLDLDRPHLARMPLVVKEDIATDPADVGLLGPDRVMEQPEFRPHLIEQPGRSRITRNGRRFRKRHFPLFICLRSRSLGYDKNRPTMKPESPGLLLTRR